MISSAPALLALGCIGSFVAGYVIGQRWGDRISARLAATTRGHRMNLSRRGARLPGYGWVWLVIGLLIVGLAVLGLVDQRRYTSQQARLQAQTECLQNYVNRIAPYTKALNDAQQILWDDFKDAQTIAPDDADGQKALRDRFFADLDAERAANQDLIDYRATNLPREACPL